jgi:hypothetical protein
MLRDHAGADVREVLRGSTAARDPAAAKARRWRVVGISLLAALGLGFAVFMGWWRALTVTPRVVVPTPVMPSPNAYDSFVRAGGLLVRDRDVGYAISSTAENRASLLGRKEHWYSTAEKAALVAQNQAALKALREGFAFPYQEPPARSFRALFPHFAKYRGIARLLGLESQVRSAKGDHAGEMRSALDAIELGVKCPRGGVLIGMLVGAACEAIGRGPAWEAMDHLGATEARQAARRLERIVAQRFAFASTMQEEKWAGEAGLVEAMQAPNWQQSLMRDLSGGGGTSSSGFELRELPRTLRALTISKTRVLQNYDHFMEESIARARMPYAVARKAPPLPVPDDPVSELLAPVFGQARFTLERAQTGDLLLMVALALRAYRLEHGRYPETLSELVPDYLSKVPADPLAPQGPLKYRRKGSSYVLYSVGPDGVDDGGRAAAGSGSSRRLKRIDETSAGDYVAGVND